MTPRSIDPLRLGVYAATVTGQPVYTDPAEQLTEQRSARGQLTLADTRLAARDAAQVYREVMGARREREQATDSPSRPRRSSTYL